MKTKSTITVSAASDSKLQHGDRISMRVPVPDKRPWSRFKCWLLRRPPPFTSRLEYYTVTAEVSGNVINLKDWRQK